jgi:hypothetical protein
VTGESPNGFSSMDRAPSPYLQKTSSRTEYAYNDMTTTVSHEDDDRAQSPEPPYRRRHIVSEDVSMLELIAGNEETSGFLY